MGWTLTREERFESIDAALRQEVGADRVVVSATVGTTWYAAVRSDHALPGAVVALVGLTQGTPQRGLGWKIMDEFSGPYYYEAPAEVLDALTPLPDEPRNEMAVRWRAACRDCLARHVPHPAIKSIRWTPETARQRVGGTIGT